MRGDHPDPSILQDGERLVRHVDLGRLAAGLPGAALERPRALAAGGRGAGAAPALGEERLLGARAGAPRRPRARLLRRAARRMAAAAWRARPPARVARPVPRPRADRLQPHRGDRPAPGQGRAGRRDGSSGSATATAAGGRTPILRRAARAGRDVARRAAARAVPRGRRWERHNVEAPALLRHGGYLYLFYSAGHCCGRNCTYATGVARAQTLLGPWEKRRRPILRGGGGDPVPRSRGRDPGARRRAAARVPRLRARGSLEPAAVHDDGSRFGVDGLASGASRRQTGARRASAEAFRTTDGWQWPAGPRPDFSATRRTARARDGHGCSPDGHDAVQRGHGARHRRQSRATEPGRDGFRGERGRDRAARQRERWLGARPTGRRRITGRLRLPPGRPVAAGGRVRLRVTIGDRVRVAMRFRGRWRSLGGLSRRRAGRAVPAWRSRSGRPAIRRGSRRRRSGPARPAPKLAREHRHALHTPLAREPPRLRAGARAGQVADGLELGGGHAARSGGARRSRPAAAQTLGDAPSCQRPPHASPRRGASPPTQRSPPSSRSAAAPGTGAARQPSRGCPRPRDRPPARASGMVPASSRSPPNASSVAFDSRSIRNRSPSRPAPRASVHQRLRPVQLPAPAHEALAQRRQVARLRLRALLGRGLHRDARRVARSRGAVRPDARIDRHAGLG